MKQRSFSMTGYFDKGKKTRREEFLAEMEQVVPWSRLLCADRAALSEGEHSRRSPADAAGADAAHLLPAAVVQPVGPRGRGSAL